MSLAPHGGIWVLGLVDGAVPYVGAVVAGVLVTSLCLVAATAPRGAVGRGAIGRGVRRARGEGPGG